MERVAALGLDVGNRRIGVAGCDATGLIATGLGLIQRRSLNHDRASLQAWIQRRQATVLVVGLPYLESGSLGTQAHRVQRFMQAMDVGLPIEYVDERLTTVAAAELLRERGIPTIQHHALIDQTAAQIILQDWLDQRRRRQGTGAEST